MFGYKFSYFIPKLLGSYAPFDRTIHAQKSLSNFPQNIR